MSAPHPAARYIIGVDLGTTNTVVAYVDLHARRTNGQRPVALLEIPQLVAPAELGHAPALPSFLYLPGAHDLAPADTALPWDATRDYAVGVLAREQGARVPARLVASAKSWLSHAGVDRTARILPWQAPREVEQVSPVEASARYLRHVREAWNERMTDGDARLRFERQTVVLTVPASFDEVARELTVEAAHRSGLPHVVLLEEPLAAFYAWLDGHAAERDAMQDGQLVLVCDVGGGTSDFSVIGVTVDDDGTRRFERLAVGDHLMLGGDNMDHALARKLEAGFVQARSKLDVQRWNQLVYGCRRAKEDLLGEAPPDEAHVTVAGTGSKLIGGTLKGTLSRADVEALVLDGFFPETAPDAPLQGRRAGLTELGLPYEADPAITRHLAAFWRRFRPLLRETTGRDAPRPDYLLFNGGAFTPPALRDRVRRIVGGWFEASWQPDVLDASRLDRAVALGAAYYGLVRLGEGTRVGSGSARAYYVGVATAEPSDGQRPAVCLVPRGAEEGFTTHLAEMPVEALTNQPVTFHLFTSTTRTGDFVGDVVELPESEVDALPPIRTVLRFGRKSIARALPVEVGVRLTEVGTLELWCQAVETEHRWELAFDVRQAPEAEEGAPEAPAEALDLEKVEAAQVVVQETFEAPKAPEADAFWERLEEALGKPRDAWTVPVLRKLADELLNTPRDASADHEVVWFDALGYTLRPGYGDAVDDWRMAEAWKRYMEGVHYQPAANRHAWWLFWRRVGGGLPAEKQAQVYYDVRPYIQLKVKTGKKHPLYPRRLDKKEKLEAWKTLATFERLPADIRAALGQLILQSLGRGKPRGSELWALARLGLRHSLYGPVSSLVPADEVGAWVRSFLGMGLPRHPHVAYTLAHLARRTGHRDRDVPDNVRREAVKWLRRMPEAARFLALADDPGAALDAEAERWLWVEPPPPAGASLAEPVAIAVRDA